MKKILLIWITLSLFAIAVKAQTQDRPFALGVFGGLTQYNGDLGNGFYDMSQTKYGHIGLNAAWYITPRFDFVLNSTYGNIGYTENKLKSFHGEQIQLNTHFNYNLVNSDKNRIIPYLLGGIGAAYYPKKYDIVPGLDFFAIFGGGIRVKITDRINLHLQEAFAYGDHDERDGEVRYNNDGFLMHSVGLTFSFAGQKDEDKDGVSDKNDKCPNTQMGVKVDDKGCPLDRDGDGIADYLDACPDVKGTAMMKGCPDRDNDLVTDSLDKCPDVAGLVALKGCPDRDADGIADADDKCPDVFGTKELNGCPAVELTDRDKDGIPDKDDRCPDTFGIALNFGCPATPVDNEVAQVSSATPVAQEIKQNIQFETGKDVLTVGSKNILNNVAKLMIAHSEYKLNIDGHTDNVGSPEKNMTLSQSRAEIVKNYLTTKSVDGSKLTTTGFGQTKPIADNKTAEGRAKNRRVEFRIQK